MVKVHGVANPRIENRTEQKLTFADQRMNDRPVCVDGLPVCGVDGSIEYAGVDEK